MVKARYTRILHHSKLFKMQTKLNLLAILLLPALLVAQSSNQSDLIIKISDDSLQVKVVEVGQNAIIYSYPDELVRYSLSKNAIREIQFSSGRVDKFNDPVMITGEADWKKVKIATFESEVAGFRKVGKVYGKANSPLGRSMEKTEEIALERIKKEAAIRGCQLIFIESRNIDPQARLWLTGVMYQL